MSRTYRKVKHDRFHRRPKTLGAKKAACAAKDDGVPMRAKRGNGRLVDSYDDIPIASRWEEVRK